MIGPWFARKLDVAGAVCDISTADSVLYKKHGHRPTIQWYKLTMMIMEDSTLLRMEGKDFMRLLSRVSNRQDSGVNSNFLHPHMQNGSYVDGTPKEAPMAGSSSAQRNVERISGIIRHFEKFIGKLKFVYYSSGYFKPSVHNPCSRSHDKLLHPNGTPFLGHIGRSKTPEIIPNAAHFDALEYEMVSSSLFSPTLCPLAVFTRPDEDDAYGESFAVVTLGLSRFHMTVPPPLDARRAEYDSAELFMYLPGSWQFPQRLTVSRNGPVTSTGSGQAQRDRTTSGYLWPLALLVSLVQYAVDRKKWLWKTHIIPNLWKPRNGVSNPQPYSLDAEFYGSILLDPVFERPHFAAVSDSPTQIFMVLPLTMPELSWTEVKGIEAIISKMHDAQLSPILCTHRPSLVSGEEADAVTVEAADVVPSSVLSPSEGKQHAAAEL